MSSVVMIGLKGQTTVAEASHAPETTDWITDDPTDPTMAEFPQELIDKITGGIAQCDSAHNSRKPVCMPRTTSRIGRSQ